MNTIVNLNVCSASRRNWSFQQFPSYLLCYQNIHINWFNKWEFVWDIQRTYFINSEYFLITLCINDMAKFHSIKWIEKSLLSLIFIWVLRYYLKIFVEYLWDIDSDFATHIISVSCKQCLNTTKWSYLCAGGSLHS